MDAPNRIRLKQGDTFGKLTVIRELPKRHGRVHYLCRCDCGKTTVVESYALRHYETLSCGCLQRKRTSESNKTHGMSRSRLYGIFMAMRRRCYVESDHAYKDYGGRGITVCDEWRHSFDNFARWAFASGYTEGLTIDRTDNMSGYRPDNCRWIPEGLQAKNRRMCIMVTIDGTLMCLSDAARHFGVVCPACAQYRVRAGWDPICAVTTPARVLRRKFRRKPKTTTIREDDQR